MSIRNNGDQMLYQAADALEEPWNEPQTLIASIPEVDRSRPRYDKNNFCYAGKEQPEFARGGKLVLTYVSNSYEDFENKTRVSFAKIFFFTVRL